jgi:hypothetical protein
VWNSAFICVTALSATVIGGYLDRCNFKKSAPIAARMNRCHRDIADQALTMTPGITIDSMTTPRMAATRFRASAT